MRCALWVMAKSPGPITHTLCVNSIRENSKYSSIFCSKKRKLTFVFCPISINIMTTWRCALLKELYFSLKHTSNSVILKQNPRYFSWSESINISQKIKNNYYFSAITFRCNNYHQMDFKEETHFNRYADGSTEVSSSKIVKLSDGSVHEIPIVNPLALQELQEKKKHIEVETILEEEDREKLLVDVSQNTISSLDHLWQITKDKQTVVEK